MIIESPKNNSNSSTTSENFNDFETSSLEIPVKFSIKLLINISGLTRELNSPICLPVESVLTAPISIILSFPGDNPVVSRSKETRLFPKL